MSQETIRTTIGRTYAVLVTQAPCTLFYQDSDEEEKLTVLTAEEPGTYAFVAFGILLKQGTGSCRIVESFNSARLGLSAKAGVKEFYITVASDGVMTPCHSKFLENGANLFTNKAIQGGRYVFERCTNAAGMFQGASSPTGEIDVSLPACAITYGIFSSSKFEEITIDAPLVTASSICPASPLLRRLNCNFPRLSTPSSFASATPLLKYVTPYFPALSNAPGMFSNSGLESPMINEILESLPRYASGKHIITFTGCPGAATCNATIATAKGWTVEI